MQKQFILIHGAWHGGWCWEGVIKELEIVCLLWKTLSIAAKAFMNIIDKIESEMMEG